MPIATEERKGSRISTLSWVPSCLQGGVRDRFQKKNNRNLQRGARPQLAADGEKEMGKITRENELCEKG